MTTPSERVEKYLREAVVVFEKQKGKPNIENAGLIITEIAKMLQREYLKDEKQPIQVTSSCTHTSGGSGPC